MDRLYTYFTDKLKIMYLYVQIIIIIIIIVQAINNVFLNTGDYFLASENSTFASYLLPEMRNF